MSSFQSVHLFKGIEGVVNGMIMFYVLGMFWAECKQLWEEGVKGVIYTKTNGYFADNQLIHCEVMIAFICGQISLYSISKNENFAGLLETTGTLFWAAFGMGNSQAPAIKEETNSSQVNGDSEIRDSVLLKVIEVVGYVLYGVYILDAVVVLINLFIAMMNLKTFRFVSCYVNH
nr:short transient receptor potential channel 3-like [Biomphalaria glabrata]